MGFREKRTPAELFSKSLTHIRFVHVIAKDLDDYDVDRKEKKQGFLYRGYVIYLVALWQTFLKHLAKESFERMVLIDPNSSFHEILRNNFDQRLKNFNTPQTRNIDELIEAATGIKKISNNWHWEGMTNENAISRLSEILSIRHEIAHTAYTGKPLSIEGNFEYMEFLVKLADILNAVIDDHIKTELQKHDSA